MSDETLGKPEEAPRDLPEFFGCFASGKPDLAERIDEMLGAELPME